MATLRLSEIVSHMTASQHAPKDITRQSPDDVVITLAIRTALCKAGRGGLKDTGLDTLVFKILEQVRDRSKLDPRAVDDICLGNVRDANAGHYTRAAALAAGFPNTSSASSISKFCGSGLAAVQAIANEVRAGQINVGIAVGAESLSEGTERLSRPFADEILNANDDARDCMLPMGGTSELVARDFNISRQEQDKYAVESYRRAEHAQKAGWFDDEIVPIQVVKDGKDVTVSRDEIRYGTTYEGVAKLPAAFGQYGDRSTAGNSSQVTDGAAAIILMKRSKAIELGQPILGKYVDTALAGVPPRIMGIGPSLAIPKLLEKYGLSLQTSIDVVEINEAFASMAVYCRDHLAVDWEKMNPRGGAIALGHPFGCTGVRQIVSGLSECRRRQKKVVLTSMCLGTGMGMAALFVNEQL